MTDQTYDPILIEAPQVFPVSLDEAKSHLDMPSSATEKDDLINTLIGAATAHLDGPAGILSHCLCEQVWQQDYDAFAARLCLPFRPIIDVDVDPCGVFYLDADGLEQTVDPVNYRLITIDRVTYVEFIGDYEFPTIGDPAPAVKVVFRAGYAGDEIPNPLKAAIKLLVRHWFDNPGAVVVGVTVAALPFAVDALISPYRKPVV
jgi:uncharacterized phiE125 gp8 family phage protein